MKRYIHSKIYAMSLFKSDAEIKIKGQAEVIHEHTAKLVLYSSIREYDINGWKKSICRAFNTISKITVKPKGKRFDVSDYVNLILSTYGEDSIDIEVELAHWRGKLTSELQLNPYPDVEINNTMINKCIDLVNLYIEFCDMISNSDSEIPASEFRDKLDIVV